MSKRTLRFLCNKHELPEGSSRGFRFDLLSGSRDIFLVRSGNRIVSYVNSCPHTGAPLDWTPGHFLDQHGTFIVCATHDARFRIDDGYCVAGPCLGRRLQPVTTITENDAVYLDNGVREQPGEL
jgi:nitrite reductase/ring-hydroxylating ferredoxin subunit